jgi:hypothetical protein
VPARAAPLAPAATIVLDVTSAIEKSPVLQLACPPSALTPTRWIVPTKRLNDAGLLKLPLSATFPPGYRPDEADV